jgi:hypothetical protein
MGENQMSIASMRGDPLRRSVVVALFAALLVASWKTRAEEQGPPPARPPHHRLVYGNLLVLRYNPLGIEDKIELEYRYRLVHSDALLWSDTYVSLGLTPTVNAALTRLGATLAVKPIAVATLSAGYYYVIWYGAFGHLRSFENPDLDYSDSAIDRGSGQAIATTGHELQLRANLVGKIGPVALSNNLEAYFADMKLGGGDHYYYQPRLDVLAHDLRWLLSNDTDLVYVTEFGLVAGLRNTVVHAFDAEGSGAGSDDTPTDRLGPLLAYVFFDRPRAAFNKPTLLLVTGFWLKHRFRTGEDVHQGVPYVVLAFKFEGEIWGSGK